MSSLGIIGCKTSIQTSVVPAAAAAAERDPVKPVTRHQTSCPDLPTTHHMTVAMPAHRRSVIASPVSTMDHSVNDDFSVGPKGSQRNTVLVTTSRKYYEVDRISTTLSEYT